MENKSPQQNHHEFRLRDGCVRIARPDEVPKWNKLMDENHYLGFKQFAGRSLRYIAQYKQQWVAIAGWQAGAFKSAPRDRWVGWKPECQFRNLHLIGNNTRFLILGKQGEFSNLASYFLGAMTRRLSADWRKHYGHGLLVAESFVDPRNFDGAMYKASNWKFVGLTRDMHVQTAVIRSLTGTESGFTFIRCEETRRRCLETPTLLGKSGGPKERRRAVLSRSLNHFTGN